MAKIRQILKGINNMRIRNKLMVAFLVVVFLPVLFVGIFLTTRMRTMALSQSFEEAESEVERVSSSLEEFVDFNVMIQNAILSDSNLYEVALVEYDTALEVFDAYSTYEKMEEYERNYDGIEDIRVYVDNETLLNNMDIMRLDSEIREEWWFKQAKLWEGKVIATYHKDPIKNKYYLLLAKYYETSTGVDVAVTTLLNLEFLHRFVENERLNIQILDAKSNILATTEPEDLGKNLYDVAGMYIVDKEASRRDFYKGMKSQLFLKPINKNYMVLPIYVMSAIPIEEILDPANDAANLGFAVIFFSLATASLLIIVFSEVLTSKTRQLVRNIRRIAKGDFEIADVYMETDEIGELSKNLYYMSRSLNELMDENLKIKEQEKQLLLAQEQMKFEVLASKVNPHFLFNVLESLRMKAHINGDKEISDGIRMLGQLMRRSLEMSEDLVTVEDEITFVSSYIGLQKFRFGDKLDYDVETDEVVGPIRILPLLIQPLVENAITHGLEGVTQDGLVKISVLAKDIGDDTFIEIVVKDNGIGMSEEDLRMLKESVFDEEIEIVYGGRRHIGLKNVYGRLKNHYGSLARMEIESIYKESTSVTIHIPLD